MKNNDVVENKEITPPPVLWAQNKAHIFLTFEIECENPEISLQNESVTFKGVGVPEMKNYEIDFKLFANVDPKKSAITNKGRNIEINLSKIDLNAQFWPFLTKDGTKHHWLKVDFNKWIDEDESDEVDKNLPIGDMFGKNLMEDNEMASLASANYDDTDIYPDRYDQDFPPEFGEEPATTTGGGGSL